ncbi:MAG TPA: aldo/keto reductase [Burkholderiales bacterium]|jgi:diketogulonate reductase-like aldo/keto reductase|nr:aldo/keto reductase [Burkholderiales bacterium]
MDPRRRALLGVLAAGALVKPAQAAPLATRAIPATGEALPIIGVGTWQTFDVGNDAAARAQLREVLELLDGNVVDSSPMYGSSEAVAGELIAGLGMRRRLFIATKVWTSGRAEGIRQMETSFRRLRVERMDLMQVHNLVDVATHTATLKDWKKQDRVRYIGITHYTASAYPEVERWIRTGNYDFLQINYSLDEREADERLLPLAREKKIAVIVNRPFGQGSLFRRVRGKALPEWAQAELGVQSWAQYFLKWIVGHPAVTCAIPGTGKPEHMRDNLAAGVGPLPDASQRARMAESLAKL